MPKTDIGIDNSEGTTPKLRGTSSRGAYHVLLRLRSEQGMTITAHQHVIAEHGSALLGKSGRPIGPKFQEALRQQIEKGIKTFLFLTIREGWNGPYVTYRCDLHAIGSSVPAGKGRLIPKYYAFDADRMATWFEIKSIERLTREEMDRIFVLTSGRSIMSSIKSSASVFGVGISAKRAL